MKILIGCERTQKVCQEFLELGFDCFSCDTAQTTGKHPERHLQMDIFEAIYLEKWALALFFPPCTYLTNCANGWLKNQQKPRSGALIGRERRRAREQAVLFVKKLWLSDIPLIAIENPIGHLSTAFKKPDQIIHPYMFGDNASKGTCLFLKGLNPLLVPPREKWHPPDRFYNGLPRYGNQTNSGADRLSPSKDRSDLRAETYPGIARALAFQFGLQLLFGKETFPDKQKQFLLF